MAKTATMKVWNVELGLAVHIKAPNGKYVVIDLGSTKNVSPIASLMFKKVGYMVITHPHHDHFRDISNIGWAKPDVLWRVKAYSREELLSGVRDQEKNDFVAYCDFCDGYSETVPEEDCPSSGNPFDGMKVRVFSTNSCDKENKNNFSAIVVIELGNAKIVVCGDNENDSLNLLMQRLDFKENVRNAWILVAPHHGRESGYNNDFVDLVHPYLTIISDTTKGETSVSDKYSAKSQGWGVWKVGEDKTSERKCLTTRNDGNIEVVFGESDNPSYPLGKLVVTTGV